MLNMIIIIMVMLMMIIVLMIVMMIMMIMLMMHHLKVKWATDNLDGYLNFYSVSGDGRLIIIVTIIPNHYYHPDIHCLMVLHQNDLNDRIIPSGLSLYHHQGDQLDYCEDRPLVS